KFSIRLTGEERATLEKYWPPYLAKGGEVEATSIVIDCPNPSFSYLSRGTKTLAFRVPGVQALRDLLLKTGPLVAPSANLEGLPPAQSVDEARKYFREGGVDLYLDGGNILKSPSKVVRLHLNGSVSVLRQ
ncbi:Sua5/YciO/YrdC/YwlC family protein, partial [Candidatus Nomurabacteria bacterium]|nr:Sua5/YciO/YrdC/YwlC family protein [Candidatus Nomurabacteria bacterium]